MIKSNEKLKTNIITGGEYLINLLIELNIDTLFGYPGAPILPIYDALSRTDKITHYLTRHEQGAIHAAEGYARVKNKCGVVLVTSGPGLTNTVTGIMNAKLDHTPLVIIAGQSEKQGENDFQDVDVVGLTKSSCKKVYQLNDINDLEKVLKSAVTESEKYPKGPCVIAVTKSVLESSIEDKQLYRHKKEIKVEAPHSCVLKTISTLQSAQRPLIIVGGGCSDAERELSEFAHLTHIPVVNTMMASGSVDNISLGMIGTNGNRLLNEYIQNADVVLALGTRFTNRTTNNMKKFLSNSKIISINIEQNTSSNVLLSKEILCEMQVALQQMIGVIKSKNILFDIKYDWIEHLSNSQEAPIISSEDLTSEYVMNEIYNYTKKYRPIITTDVGDHQIIATKIFKTCSSKNFLTSGGFGTMGFGLPASIGAHIAKPNSLVLNITGDGSFQMNMQELGTCAEYNIPVKIIIMNNSSLGMIKNLQEQKYSKSFESDMINPDFIKIAEAYGILGYRITNKHELRSALKEIFIYKKAVLLDIIVKD